MFDSSKVNHWKPRDLASHKLFDGNIYHNSLYSDEFGLKPRNWHKLATKPLIDLAVAEIKNGDVIIDYGSGTGGSAMELVKRLDKLDLDYNLILVDPLESWFSKAFSLLSNRPNVYFCKSYGKDPNGNFSFFSLDKLLGGNKADVILSSSTIHLIPPNILQSLFDEFHHTLSKHGKFIWSSGDIPSKDMPYHSHLLHDPYRELTKLVSGSDEYHKFEKKYDDFEIEAMRKKADKIFPLSNDIEFYLNALEKSNFNGEFFTRIVPKSIDECKLFIKTPRLSEIATSIKDLSKRNSFIEKLLLTLSKNSEQSSKLKLFANGTTYDSYWHYGVFTKFNNIK